VQVLDMKVSKEHFEIGLPMNGGDASIRDCGSSHGTLLNGQPIAPETPRPLVPGDEIRVGLTVLRVLSDGPADADAQAALADDGASAAVGVRKGNPEMEKHVSTDGKGTFNWPIHPEGFSAPQLLELARLQAWTLKPARLK